MMHNVFSHIKACMAWFSTLSESISSRTINRPKQPSTGVPSQPPTFQVDVPSSAIMMHDTQNGSSPTTPRKGILRSGPNKAAPLTEPVGLAVILVAKKLVRFADTKTEAKLFWRYAPPAVSFVMREEAYARQQLFNDGPYNARDPSSSSKPSYLPDTNGQ
jgi:hypothetical protein